VCVCVCVCVWMCVRVCVCACVCFVCVNITCWRVMSWHESCHLWMSHAWGHVTYEWFMPRMGLLCHPWMSHVTCEWAVSHMNEWFYIWISNFTYIFFVLIHMWHESWMIYTWHNLFTDLNIEKPTLGPRSIEVFFVQFSFNSFKNCLGSPVHLCVCVCVCVNESCHTLFYTHLCGISHVFLWLNANCYGKIWQFQWYTNQSQCMP